MDIQRQRDQFPFRTASYNAHQDLAECHRAHGTFHASCGRIMPGWKVAVADTATQESRLADTAGWSHHVAVPPSPMAIQGAQAYSSLKGFDDPHASDYTHIMQDPQRVARVGRHYDSLPTYTPDAVPHFLAMQKEVNDQYDFLTKRMGINVQPVDYDPYANVQELMNDIHGNKTLKVLGSHVTGGHPIFGNEDNDKFRAVHDFFGHAATGRDFDRHGEHATYLAHGKMFTPHALPALTTETLGQNSSLILNGHFGPNKIGTIPRELTARLATFDVTDENGQQHYSGDREWNEVDTNQFPYYKYPGLGKPHSGPKHNTTPLFNTMNRPLNPDGTYVFSPNEANPEANTSARPVTPWYGTYHDDEPLPLEHPSVDIREDGNRAVERQPYTLHRGVEIYLPNHDGSMRGQTPELQRLRRLLLGREQEAVGRKSIDRDNNWSQMLDGMPSDFNAAYNSKHDGPHPLGHEHPEIPELVIRHLLATDDLHEDNHKDSLGRHWSTDRDMANRFAKVFPNQQYFDPNRLSAVLSGRWKGVGEDPYRRFTDGDFSDESEISLLPGAPVTLHQVHVYNPRKMEWVTHDLGDPQHHTAGKKNKKKKDKAPKPPKPPRFYRDWKGPHPMWFGTEDGDHQNHEEIFENSPTKQLYQLLRNDNTFAQQYQEHMRGLSGRELIGFLRQAYPDVMDLLGDL